MYALENPLEFTQEVTVSGKKPKTGTDDKFYVNAKINIKIYIIRANLYDAESIIPQKEAAGLRRWAPYCRMLDTANQPERQNACTVPWYSGIL